MVSLNTETHKTHTVGKRSAAFMAERRTDGRQCRGQIKEDLKEIQFKKKKQSIPIMKGTLPFKNFLNNQ